MSDILIGLDPSFSRTGICVINIKDKTIEFYSVSCKIGEKQFENVVHSSQSIVNQLKEVFSKYSEFTLISESPLPCSSMSSALYSLDTLIYHTFENNIARTYNPATLRSKIHGHKYDKKDSQTLAEKYLKILTDSGYIILSEMGTKKKVCHDSAEAFLYCHLYLHDSGHPDFQFNNTDEIQKYKLRMKELKKREKMLMQGEK